MSSKVKFLYDEHLDNPATTIRVYNHARNNELVVKAFYQDDFHMSITNQWSTGDSTILKTLVDSAASLVTGRGAQTLQKAAEWGMDWATKGLDAKNKSTGFIGKVNSAINSMGNLVNSKIYTADDFYKTFKGSNVTFPLNLQVTLVSDEMFPKEDIYDKLRKILNVSIGDYNSTGFGFIGIQNAPNGFRTGGLDLNEENKIMDGTLKVAYGDPLRGGYTLNNMLISNVHCTFSKTKVQIDPSTWRPLYVDVQIMLEPGRKFTQSDIVNSLGINKASLKDRTNFKSINGKSSKETSEKRLARNKELEQLKLQKNKVAIKNQIAQDFSGSFEKISFSVENGVLLLSGQNLEEGDKLGFRDAMSDLDLSKYPGITKVRYQLND